MRSKLALVLALVLALQLKLVCRKRPILPHYKFAQIVKDEMAKLKLKCSRRDWNRLS